MAGKPSGELENLLGETQRPGDPNVLGLPRPLPADIPVGIAPGFPRHVYSTFDSRPIGAYDFAVSARDFGNLVLVPVETIDLTYIAPQGYVTFLRRVEFTFSPVLALLSAIPGFDFQLLRDNAVIQNVLWDSGAQSYSEFAWSTAQIYQAGQQVGARIQRLAAQADFVPGMPELYMVTARFIGTLIIDSGETPAELVGSNEDKIILRFIRELLAAREGR